MLEDEKVYGPMVIDPHENQLDRVHHDQDGASILYSNYGADDEIFLISNDGNNGGVNPHDAQRRLKPKKPTNEQKVCSTDCFCVCDSPLSCSDSEDGDNNQKAKNLES
jgi:hypothetical protein